MFDSPVADQMPGLIEWVGFPYHGLIRAVDLESAESCARSRLVLDTHGGLTLMPFPPSPFEPTASRPVSGVIYRTMLFRDPRGTDAEEEETGEDLSQYLVMSQWLSMGEASFLRQSEAVYSTGGATHVWEFAGGELRFYDQIVIDRLDAQEWRSHEVLITPTGDAGTGSLIEATPDGTSALRLGATLTRYELSGAWPDITAVGTYVLAANQLDHEQASRTAPVTGLLPEDSRERWYNLIAFCNRLLPDEEDSVQCDFEVYDDYYNGTASPPILYLEPADYSYQYLRQLFVTAWFEGSAVKTVFFESVRSDVFQRGVSKGVRNSTVTAGPDVWAEVGVSVTAYVDSNESRNALAKARLTADGQEVSALTVTYERTSTHDRQYVEQDGGLFGTTEEGGSAGSYTEATSRSSGITMDFDGEDVLGHFPEVDASSWGISLDGAFGNADAGRLSSGSGEQLEWRATVFYYSRDLVCLRLLCTYTQTVSNVVVSSRQMVFYGSAFSRGVQEDAVHIKDSVSVPHYGAACPQTKKIVRDYPYPVVWI